MHDQAPATGPLGRRTPRERWAASVAAADRWQQAHRGLAVAVAVVRKFGDDRGGSLAALFAYYGFLAVFPLLLVLTTVLGFVGNDRLEHHVIGTALHQFPVVGDQIGATAAHPLHGSGLGLVVGLLGLLYGSLGIVQIAQRALADVWDVPEDDRPGFAGRLGRGLAFLAALAVALLASSVLAGLATGGGSRGPAMRVGLLAVELAVAVGLMLVAFCVLTPIRTSWRTMLPGAVVAGLAYAGLVVLGAALVQHQLRRAQAVYGQFAFVLGLLGWLVLVSQVTLYGAELNVVLHRHLWPRLLVGGEAEPP